MKPSCVGVSLIFVAFASTTLAAGVGALYGTREPASCPSRKEPTRGALSNEQARRYFICDWEHEDGADNLYLVDNVTVRVGKSRPFVYSTDGFQGVDPTKPVYEITGSYRRYQCSALNTLQGKTFPGHACSTMEHPQATGICYLTTSADWHCRMSDINSKDGPDHVPPPKGF